MSDFIVTVHALDRMEERCPSIAEGKDDLEIASFIQNEVLDALEAGRRARVPPIELSPNDVNIDRSTKGGETCWTPHKERGYIFREEESGAITVMTVLVGGDRSASLGKLRNELGKKIRHGRLRSR
jgi:hypothetical protein